MGSRVLVDTSIVIDLFRNVPQATPTLRQYPERAISVVTWMEVMLGLQHDFPSAVAVLEREFPVIAFSHQIAQETVLVRQASKLKLPDAMILATAHIEKRVLITRNTRDFKEGRFVHIPYEL